MAAHPTCSCKTLHYTRPAQKVFLSLWQILTDFPFQIWQPYQQLSPTSLAKHSSDCQYPPTIVFEPHRLALSCLQEALLHVE